MFYFTIEIDFNFRISRENVNKTSDLGVIKLDLINTLMKCEGRGWTLCPNWGCLPIQKWPHTDQVLDFGHKSSRISLSDAYAFD